MFWDNLCKLCREKGISPTKLGEIIGSSGAAASGWKNGAVPYLELSEHVRYIFIGGVFGIIISRE